MAEGAPAAVCPTNPGRADGTLEGLDVCADDMFMTQPLLTHVSGFPLLILVGWIPVLLLDLGALGLGLNRASFNDSNPGWFQPLPPRPPRLHIFPHPTLLQNLSISELQRASSIVDPVPPFLDGETEAQGRKGLAPGHPNR